MTKVTDKIVIFRVAEVNDNFNAKFTPGRGTRISRANRLSVG